MDKFVVMSFNCAHPSGEPKPFLMHDDNDNTIIFDTYEQALDAAKNGSWGPFICAVVDLSELKTV